MFCTINAVVPFSLELTVIDILQQPFPVGFPFEQIRVDFLSSFVKTDIENLLSKSGYATKWVEGSKNTRLDSRGDSLFPDEVNNLSVWMPAKYFNGPWSKLLIQCCIVNCFGGLG